LKNHEQDQQASLDFSRRVWKHNLEKACFALGFSACYSWFTLIHSEISESNTKSSWWINLTIILVVILFSATGLYWLETLGASAAKACSEIPGAHYVDLTPEQEMLLASKESFSLISRQWQILMGWLIAVAVNSSIASFINAISGAKRDLSFESSSQTQILLYWIVCIVCTATSGLLLRHTVSRRASIGVALNLPENSKGGPVDSEDNIIDHEGGDVTVTLQHVLDSFEDLHRGLLSSSENLSREAAMWIAAEAFHDAVRFTIIQLISGSGSGISSSPAEAPGSNFMSNVTTVAAEAHSAQSTSLARGQAQLIFSAFLTVVSIAVIVFLERALKALSEQLSAEVDNINQQFFLELLAVCELFTVALGLLLGRSWNSGFKFLLKSAPSDSSQEIYTWSYAGAASFIAVVSFVIFNAAFQNVKRVVADGPGHGVGFGALAHTNPKS